MNFVGFLKKYYLNFSDKIFKEKNAMNILYIKNISKKAVVINDIPKIPKISPGEIINLFEYASPEQVKKSLILQNLLNSKFLEEIEPPKEEPEVVEEEYEEILDEEGKIKPEFMPEQFDELFKRCDGLVDYINKYKEETTTCINQVNKAFENSINNLQTLVKQQSQHYDTMIKQIISKEPQLNSDQILQTITLQVNNQIKAAVTKSSQTIVSQVLEEILPQIKKNENKINGLSLDRKSNGFDIPQLKSDILNKKCKNVNFNDITPGELKQVVELIVFARRETDFTVKNIHINFELD